MYRRPVCLTVSTRATSTCMSQGFADAEISQERAEQHVACSSISALFSCNSSLSSLPSHPAGGYSVNVRRVSYTGYRDLTLLSAHVIQLFCGLQCSPSPQSQQQYQQSYPWHQRGLAAPWMMIATYPSAPTPWQLATAALKARSRVRQVARPQHRESYLVAPFRDYSGHQRLC